MKPQLANMSAGVAAADPMLDALHDSRVGRQRRKATCQHLNVDQACIGERCSKRVVLLSRPSASFAKTQSCGSRHKPRPGAVPVVSNLLTLIPHWPQDGAYPDTTQL